MFFRDDERLPEGVRATGFPRYREVLERNWKHFTAVGFITLCGFIPAGIGIFFAVMTQGSLVLAASAIVGGIFAGPALAGMTDCIFRALRDCRDDWWVSYKKQFRQNWKGSILPGIVFVLFVGFAVFTGMMMFVWSQLSPTGGTVAVYVFSIVIAAMFFSVYFPQLVLFEQRTSTRLKNCVFFFIRYFPQTLGVSVLQTAWWLATALFMPWTAFVVPFLSVWFIMYVTFFLLYRRLDEAFSIEKQIEDKFPGQIATGEVIEKERKEKTKKPKNLR